MIGYLYNNLIARSGEIVRVLLVRRAAPRLGATGSAVTIGADRLIDVTMVLLISAAVIVLSPFETTDLAASPRASRSTRSCW